MHYSLLKMAVIMTIYKRLPRRPPLRLVLSEGMGVTSSILPIFIPDRANALRADCAPGPGVFVLDKDKQFRKNSTLKSLIHSNPFTEKAKNCQNFVTCFHLWLSV